MAEVVWMKLDKCYELLKIADKDRILVDCMESLLLSAYIIGRAKKEGLNIVVHAIVDPESKILSEMDALGYAKKNFRRDFDMISEGVSLMTFTVGELAAYSTKATFNKVVLEREDAPSVLSSLSKANQLSDGEKKVVLSLPFQFFRRFTIARKQFFGEKKEIMSFRQLLAGLGFQISFYDAVEDRLICVFSVKNFDGKFGLSPISFDEFGDSIRKEIIDYIVYTSTEARFGIESDDKEYIYFIRGQKTRNEPIQCTFVFLDGKGSWATPDSKEESRSFLIIVLPNTYTFKRELDEKEIVVLGKEKAFELYGEKIEPY